MVPQDEHIKKLKGLYKNLGYVTYFVHWRCFHAPYLELERLVSKKGKIIDVGCGYGLFANLLSLVSPKREIIGLDICARKLKYADRGLPGVKFILADAFRLAEFGRYNAIVMVHLLHHLPSYASQAELLRLCHSALLDKGHLLILEIDTRPLFKFLFTQLVDNVAYFRDKFYFRSSQGFKKLLENQGFQNITIYPAGGKSLLSHVIISSQKLT